jgi:hypothetical protein
VAASFTPASAFLAAHSPTASRAAASTAAPPAPAPGRAVGSNAERADVRFKAPENILSTSTAAQVILVNVQLPAIHGNSIELPLQAQVPSAWQGTPVFGAVAQGPGGALRRRLRQEGARQPAQ